MKDIGIIKGSADQAKPVIIGKDTVYVHENIHQEGNLFSYHEYQYEKDEYVQVLSERNNKLEEQVTQLQILMTLLYEGKEDSDLMKNCIAMVYATLINKGSKSLIQVPQELQEIMKDFIEVRNGTDLS